MGKVTSSDTVQKLNQSYAMQASKNAVSNAASYTKSGVSSFGAGVKSGLGSLKSSVMGLASGASPNDSVLVKEGDNNDSLFAGGAKEDVEGRASNGHGDSTSNRS